MIECCSENQTQDRTICFPKCFKNYKSRDLRQDKYNKLEKSACISLIFFVFHTTCDCHARNTFLLQKKS